jgi:hypothetical protein
MAISEQFESWLYEPLPDGRMHAEGSVVGKGHATHNDFDLVEESGVVVASGSHRLQVSRSSNASGVESVDLPPEFRPPEPPKRTCETFDGGLGI